MKNKITRSMIEEVVGGKVIASKGIFKFRRGFFYTHGYTSEKFAASIAEKLGKAGFAFMVIEHHEHWASWPKDSYWEVSGKIELQQPTTTVL